MRVSLVTNGLFFKGALAPLEVAGRPPPHPPRISVTPLSGRARERCGVVRFLGGVGAALAFLANCEREPSQLAKLTECILF